MKKVKPVPEAVSEMPETVQEKLDRLSMTANAISDEYDLAARNHETWKPMVSDKDLHDRIGRSFAAHTFGWIRDAVRRDMVLALMRIWDSGKGTLNLFRLMEDIDNPEIMDALVARRSERVPASIEPQMRQRLSDQRERLRAMIDEYGEGGASEGTLDRLRIVRNGVLAHNLSTKRNGKKMPDDLTDAMVDQFYQHTSGIVRGVLSLLDATAYNPDEAAAQYGQCAGYFWEGVKGEQTEGHPHMARTAATRARLAEKGFLPSKIAPTDGAAT